MSAGSFYDTGAPTIEARIYPDSRLLVRRLVETEEDAPGDILAPDGPLTSDDDDDHSIDSATIPGRGTE